MSDSAEQLPLPGLDPRPANRHVSDLEDAVRRTIAAHQAAGHLTPADAGKLGIALELCRVAGVKRSGGRLSTVSNDLRLLTEILESLAPTEDDDANTRLTAAMREWEEALRHGRSADPGTEVLDQA